MTTLTRHFVLTPDDGIREFSPEQAAAIALGENRVPEFAGHDLRYLQLTLDDSTANGELHVVTAGARIHFDDQGRFSVAGDSQDAQPFSRFEHDAVVQWALRDIPSVAPVFH